MFKELPQYQALWNTLWTHKTTAIRIVGIVTIIMLIYVLIMPQKFTSTVTMLPPQQEKSNMGLASLLSGGSMPLMDLSSSLGFGSRPADLYLQVLQSRTVAESLIVNEHLYEFFEIDPDESYRHAIEPLQEASTFEASKDGILTVSVALETGFFASSDDVDSIKAFAAHLANQYVYWMDQVNREKLISKARQSREFVQEEIVRTQVELDTAFQKLVQFQKKNKSVYLEKQMEVALHGAAGLKEQIYKAQVELGMKSQDFEADSKIIRQLESEIDQLQMLYNQLNVSSPSNKEDFYVPFARLPEVARELAGLLRDVKIMEQVILFLNQQYYQDRVQEAKDTPTIQVLDEAIPAIKRTSPRRALWMVLTVLFSSVAAVIYIAARYRPKAVPDKSDEKNGEGSDTSA